MSPNEFGWLREETTQNLSPLAVPWCIALTPEDILQLIKINASVVLRDHVGQCTVCETRHGRTTYVREQQISARNYQNLLLKYFSIECISNDN